MTSQYFSKGKSSQAEESQPTDFGQAVVFKYEELQAATKNFHPSEEIGRGGFGVVYQGKLKDGKTVAVKELFVKQSHRTEVAKQFLNEVCILSNLSHKNLVKLYGSTNPEDEKLFLVYELLPGGTVADHLRGTREKTLSWDQRIKIAIETAEVLSFLHNVPNPPIIHRDVKTENILLDDNFNVKLIDFGMARLVPSDGWSHVSTLPQGTQGYQDPESKQLRKTTTKSDVYSFGVVLMELISGKPALDEGLDIDIWLANTALNKIRNNELNQLVDPQLGYHSNEQIKSMVISVAKLASSCLRRMGKKRPSMQKILIILKQVRDGKQPAMTTASSHDYSATASDEILHNILRRLYNTGLSIIDGQHRERNEKEWLLADFGSEFIFDFDRLEEATKCFNPAHVIGEGGYGVVYRGDLENGKTVAVKELFVRHQNRTKQFMNEVRVLSGLRHKNIVTLYGCTNPEDEKLFLVYEYMPNGTVADHLYRKRKEGFSWTQRVKVAIETAEALVYLHSQHPPIIHRDVKIENILLDNDFNVKLADFGMCMVLSEGIKLRGSLPYVSAPPQGTQGYLDPASSNYHVAATYNDVYSFGVILVELITGNRALDNKDNNGQVDIKFILSKLPELFDQQLRYQFKEVTSIGELAQNCMRHDSVKRPSMQAVLMTLKEIIKGKQLPDGHLLEIRNDGIDFDIECVKNQILRAISDPDLYLYTDPYLRPMANVKEVASMCQLAGITTPSPESISTQKSFLDLWIDCYESGLTASATMESPTDDTSLRYDERELLSRMETALMKSPTDGSSLEHHERLFVSLIEIVLKEIIDKLKSNGARDTFIRDFKRIGDIMVPNAARLLPLGFEEQPWYRRPQRYGIRHWEDAEGTQWIMRHLLKAAAILGKANAKMKLKKGEN